MTSLIYGERILWLRERKMPTKRRKQTAAKMRNWIFIGLSFMLFSKCDTLTSPQAPNMPIINFFSANPSEVEYGETSILSWNVSNASMVIVAGKEVGSSGSLETYPLKDDVTFVLEASNKDGKVQKTAKVVVKGCANIIMIEGPSWKDYGNSHFIFGVLKNVGNKEAVGIKVRIYLKRSDETLIYSGWAIVGTICLRPGESTGWLIEIIDKAIRSQIDNICKITYEITWDR